MGIIPKHHIDVADHQSIIQRIHSHHIILIMSYVNLPQDPLINNDTEAEEDVTELRYLTHEEENQQSTINHQSNHTSICLWCFGTSIAIFTIVFVVLMVISPISFSDIHIDLPSTPSSYIEPPSNQSSINQSSMDQSPPWSLNEYGYANITTSQVSSCLKQLTTEGDILFLGNSIMRGLYAFLNHLVNSWPALTRQQQKALCKQDPATGSWIVDCDFSNFSHVVPLYYDEMQFWCEEPHVADVLNKDRFTSVWVMAGHTDIHQKFPHWTHKAAEANSCIERQFANWTQSPSNTLIFSSPTHVCSTPEIWGHPAVEFTEYMHEAMEYFIFPAFRRAGAKIVDMHTATSAKSGPFNCSHVDSSDFVHPVALYPRLAILWLEQACAGLELPEPLADEIPLFDMVYKAVESPTVDKAMPTD